MGTNAKRRTIVAHGRLAMRELRLDATRRRLHGLQILSFEQLAARMAGGFTRPVDDESLRSAIQVALPETALGELDGIKLLPGMVDAAADTLNKTKTVSVKADVKAIDDFQGKLAEIKNTAIKIYGLKQEDISKKMGNVAMMMDFQRQMYTSLGPRLTSNIDFGSR